MGVVIGGKAEEVPGVLVRSWRDRSLLRLNMGEDGRPGIRDGFAQSSYTPPKAFLVAGTSDRSRSCRD